MTLDRSFGLHAICVRVGAGHKEHGQAFGVSFITRNRFMCIMVVVCGSSWSVEVEVQT
jgi:hypothetical protein